MISKFKEDHLFGGGSLHPIYTLLRFLARIKFIVASKRQNIRNGLLAVILSGHFLPSFPQITEYGSCVWLSQS